MRPRALAYMVLVLASIAAVGFVTGSWRHFLDFLHWPWRVYPVLISLGVIGDFALKGLRKPTPSSARSWLRTRKPAFLVLLLAVLAAAVELTEIRRHLLDFLHWSWWVYPALIGLVGIGAYAAKELGRHTAPIAPQRPAKSASMRQISAWWMVAGIVAVTATMWITTALLLQQAAAAGSSADRASARIEAVRTGLTAAGGVGAATALLLAFRRQKHQEWVAAGVDYDAAEKRITELYVKSIEQLGSAMAPVRLGGFYALERLAQNNPEHRQTITDVICAYLRMPYTPPGIATDSAVSSEVPAGVAPPTTVEPGNRKSREELQVRLAAQRILTGHLRDDRPDGGVFPPNAEQYPRYWNVQLDLTAATLVDLDLSRCHLRKATFDSAAFHGGSTFNGTLFAGRTGFNAATFTGDVTFAGAYFTDDIDLRSATFYTNDIGLGHAKFAKRADCTGAQVREDRDSSRDWKRPESAYGMGPYGPFTDPYNPPDTRCPGGWHLGPAVDGWQPFVEAEPEIW
ncbi:pentapeptide repeat-containing protein [Longispora fulva]|uniref:Pentapeptide repeat protein n=1 Tax=Longispora fulva TaxID=619741 RepID=A0A8J7GHH0_9ACTN|nr:pentapeptide repeat-containing protein [Longispora fulva]MBG6136343.1 hypothetical protein [Longispora fulva]